MKVLIIGAGPVGLTCAHLLAKLNIQVTIIEKQLKLTHHPSAHFLHSRTMEIFDGLDISEAIYKAMPPTDYWRRFIYCSHLQGEVYRSHDHFSSLSFKKNQSLSSFLPAHFPQHKLVHLLHELLPKKCELVLGQEFHELHFDSGVTIKTISGDTFQADYLIACDGASSKVRKFLNIPLVSSGVLQSFLNIHFFSKQLGKIAKKNPAMIYFVYNPDAVVVIVMHNPDEGEFVMQVPFYPPLTHPSDYTLTEVQDLINKCVRNSEEITDIHVNSMKQWKMTTQYPEVIQKQKVFLAGDAAHSLTPAGGFGLNTGIGDVHNLAWKFVFPSLLHTYQLERIPRIQEIIKSSIMNYNLTIKIAQNFGLDLSYAKTYQNIVEKLPFGNSLFSFGMKLGQRYLINDNKAENYLAHEANLLHLMHPVEDLEFRYPTGFFLNGGELAPNSTVEYEGKKYSMRLLPGVLSKLKGKPLFLYVKGQEKLPEIEYEKVEVKSEDGVSYVLRPDGHVYWSSKLTK